MGNIRILKPHIVDQIAAGEVIARPASVVKELIENSLDAAALNIEVIVRDGGKRLIEVRDDGEGIGFDDLPLALASHATSKIENPADLFSVGTFGFRGEALASIGSVAQVTVTSLRQGQEAGGSISMDGGKLGAPKECAARQGTAIKVENIFFNTPARRKFLKGAATEIGHIGEAITRLALAHPGVSFTLFHNDKNVFRATGAGDLRERVSQFFGNEFAAGLLTAEEEAGALRIEALIAPPHETRSSSQNQYIYVNNRFLRDRVILAAIAEAYREFVEPRRHAVAFCFIDMPPEDVDVNVHPTKIEVRFSRPNQIFSLVRGALHDALRAGGLAVPVSIDRAKRPPSRLKPPSGTPDIPSLRQRMSPPVETAQRENQAAPTTAREPAPVVENARVTDTSPGAAQVKVEMQAAQPAAGTVAGETETGKIPEVFIQLHDSFILVETDRGFEVIDQHALHERIIYEKLRLARQSSAVEAQQLLVPESLELQPGRIELALDNIDAFRDYGFDIEHFGRNTVLIRSVPAALRRTDPVAFFRDLLDELAESGSARGPVDPEKLLATIACKGAIKAGQRLTRGEIIALLSERASLGDTYACPHGRPTTLLMSKEELEKHFRRR